MAGMASPSASVAAVRSTLMFTSPLLSEWATKLGSATMSDTWALPPRLVGPAAMGPAASFRGTDKLKPSSSGSVSAARSGTAKSETRAALLLLEMFDPQIALEQRYHANWPRFE